MSGLKKRLDDAKGKWVDELHHILWTYRTTPRISTGETHFSMTYVVEVVIPLEFGFPTLRIDQFNFEENNCLLHVLWTYRTTPQRSTGETHFSMTYVVEVVIPLEFEFPTLRIDQFNFEENNCLLLDNLDVAEERREVAMVKMTYDQ